MAWYVVAVEEILCRDVEVEADSYGDAVDAVAKMYYDGDLVLDASDLCLTNFDCIGELNNRGDE